MNLFSSLENSQNIVLSVLEKIWSKYVHLNKIADQLQGRYIDRVILAFLGSPTFRIQIDDIMEKNSIEQLATVVLGKERLRNVLASQIQEEGQLISGNPSKQLEFPSMTNFDTPSVNLAGMDYLETDYPR